MANSDIVSMCVDYVSHIYRLRFLSFWLYMFYISVLVTIALLVYRFIDHCSQNKKSCHFPKMFSQPIWNPDTSLGFASIMTRFSFSRFSFSRFSFSCFSFSCFSFLFFHSITFLYLAFILSVYLYFSFYTICLFFYHAPISWVLVLLSTCVSFSLCHGALWPDCVTSSCRTCAFPVLSCLPVLMPHTLLFLSSGISVCAACLCTAIFSSAPSRLSAWI